MRQLISDKSNIILFFKYIIKILIIFLLNNSILNKKYIDNKNTNVENILNILNAKKIDKLLYIKNKDNKDNIYFIKYNNSLNISLYDFLFINNIKTNSIKNLINQFPKLNKIKYNQSLYFFILKNKNISKIIWNVSNKEKIIFECINNNFIEIKVINLKNKKLIIISSLFNINFFINNIKKNILNDNYIKTIKSILNKITNINKLKTGDKISIIILNYNNIYNLNKSNNKLIGIKVYTNNKKYYALKLKNDNKFYDQNANSVNYNKFIFPIIGKINITSNFSNKRLNPITNRISPHNGIDIKVPIGTSIFSICDGIIKKVSYDKNAGNFIVIDHNNNYITKYMHLNKSLVKTGQIIKKGDLIAISGNSGRTTGPHLHFEIWDKKKAINPLNVKKLNKLHKLYGNKKIEFIKFFNKINSYID
ncbi:cell wall endopeptidase family M23/M37 [endosymbiont of Sipalinus gigas]|uniref:peptidoglycan DD-metalloendopeptidase family protein n=1 Tax=endosymbiont of Sipalinus gigas TaxID=1972134 RepID=UPI000DC71A49|nr:peptidoglycan DD-metalloendopeptidase family protein [endosymbiont of Sipalinus gigas]BBA85225.1 cell wall endopeptidase family M23/M37 [endosymbiont of Sipalinus gigas]